MKKCPECPPHDQNPNRGTGLIAQNKEIKICKTCKGSGVVDDDGSSLVVTLSQDRITNLIGIRHTGG